MYLNNHQSESIESFVASIIARNMSASSSPSPPPMPPLGESWSLSPIPSIDTSLNNAEAALSKDPSESSSTTTSSNKRWTWTKPEGKPKRPLSSYNLFFRNCREKLVAGLPLESALATGNAVADEQLSQDLAYILSDLANTRANEARLVSSGLPPPKRIHKRLHGKVSFKEMAKTVGGAWKNLDTTTRIIYDAAAAVEKKRYVAEVQRWKKTPTTELKKKKAKKSSNVINQSGTKAPQGPTNIFAPTAADAKAVAKPNSIRNAERRRLAAIKTIADQNKERHESKKKDPFDNKMNPSALSMMSLASSMSTSTSPELSHPIPSSMASYIPDTTPILASNNTISSPNLDDLMQQFQQRKQQLERHQASQQGSYIPSQLLVSATRRLLEKTGTFRSSSSTNPLSFHTKFNTKTALAPSDAAAALAMDVEPEPCIGHDEGRLTPLPPVCHIDQSTTVAECLRRSSSLLSLSDVPLDFSEEDFKNVSNIFEEEGPATAATAAAAFGAKPESQQVSFQQTTSLTNVSWEGQQQGQNDDSSTMLNHWGGARSA